MSKPSKQELQQYVNYLFRQHEPIMMDIIQGHPYKQQQQERKRLYYQTVRKQEQEREKALKQHQTIRKKYEQKVFRNVYLPIFKSHQTHDWLSSIRKQAMDEVLEKYKTHSHLGFIKKILSGFKKTPCRRVNCPERYCAFYHGENKQQLKRAMEQRLSL
jgi:hypothetical protein